MNSFRTKISLSLIVIFICIFFSYLNSFFHTPIIEKHSSESYFSISKGKTKDTATHMLKKNGLIDSFYRFKILSFILYGSVDYKHGDYVIINSDTERILLDKIVSGNTVKERITIIEGMKFQDITNILEKNKYIDTSISNFSLYTPEILKDYYDTSYEGFCFPDTYIFSRNISNNYILKKCFAKMGKILKHYWENRSKNLPYNSPYDLLILASIIEKETSNNLEKGKVASVFINRLNKKMRLQSDPTVIYGIKDFDGNLKRSHLKIKNKYNTYKIKGLPLTPICSPGEESIAAASKPSKTNYLYFVSNNKGSHIFSETYEEHKTNVNKYQKR